MQKIGNNPDVSLAGTKGLPKPTGDLGFTEHTVVFGVKAACEGLFWAVSTQKWPKHFLRAEAAAAAGVWSQEQLLSLVPGVPLSPRFWAQGRRGQSFAEEICCVRGDSGHSRVQTLH